MLTQGRTLRRWRSDVRYDHTAAGPAEQVAALRGHNPQLTIYMATTSEHPAALDAAILPRTRLVAFSSAVIAPSSLLGALGFGAHNFHPGPPEYPGGRRRTSRFTTARPNSAPPCMRWRRASIPVRSSTSRGFRFPPISACWA